MTINPIYTLITSRPYGTNNNKTSNNLYLAGIDCSYNKREHYNGICSSNLLAYNHYNNPSYKSQSPTKNDPKRHAINSTNF